jgi:hypothetical protein
MDWLGVMMFLIVLLDRSLFLIVAIPFRQAVSHSPLGLLLGLLAACSTNRSLPHMMGHYGLALGAAVLVRVARGGSDAGAACTVLRRVLTAVSAAGLAWSVRRGTVLDEPWLDVFLSLLVVSPHFTGAVQKARAPPPLAAVR